MYGDKLKQAIDTINDYLQQGSELILWDANNLDTPQFNLTSESELKFIVFKIDEN